MKNRLETSIAEPDRRPAPRMFTPAEANRSLILVKRVVQDILAEYRRLLDLQEVADAAQKSGQEAQADQTRRHMIASVEKIQHYVEELDLVGVELRDWTTGVVDFPSVVAGRKIALCWKHGEPQVNYWYDDGGDIDDRRALETLPTEPLVVSKN